MLCPDCKRKMIFAGVYDSGFQMVCTHCKIVHQYECDFYSHDCNE